MDTTSQWPQEKPMDENEIVINRSSKSSSSSGLERRIIRPPHKAEQVSNCPRCNSSNTKFCYYNNYSLTQPRYFCKTCRRYWTQGGTLRNIPVGGGSRKNKRSSSSSSSSLSAPSLTVNIDSKLPDLIQNPKLVHATAQDLNLGFPVLSSGYKSLSELVNMPNFEEKSNNNINETSALGVLNGSSRRLNCYMPAGDQYTSGFSLPEFNKSSSSLSFSLDGYGSSLQESTSIGRLLFPFEDLKVQLPSTTTTTTNFDHVLDQNNKDINGDHSSGVYWNGVLGGGSW